MYLHKITQNLQDVLNEIITPKCYNDEKYRSLQNLLIILCFILTLYNLRIEAYTHTHPKYNTTLTKNLFPAPT